MRHPKIRPCTAEDLQKYFDGKFPWTARALVFDLDGEILGLGGIYYTNRIPMAFSDFKEELKEHPITMARGAIEIMKIVKTKMCFAIADKRYEGAPKLLERLGFVHIREGIYQWQIH